MSTDKLPIIDHIDQLDRVITKTEFVSSMLTAWDVEANPITYDDISGLVLFLDDIIDGIRRGKEVLEIECGVKSHS